MSETVREVRLAAETWDVEQNGTAGARLPCPEELYVAGAAAALRHADQLASSRGRSTHAPRRHADCARAVSDYALV